MYHTFRGLPTMRRHALVTHVETFDNTFTFFIPHLDSYETSLDTSIRKNYAGPDSVPRLGKYATFFTHA